LGQLKQKAILLEIIPIQVPFPEEFGSGIATNAYLLKGDRTILVDSGVDSTRNRVFLKEVLQSAGAWGPDVILVTHGHHDHFGLAPYIQRETGSEIMISEADSLALRDYCTFTLQWFEEIFELGVEGGYNRQELEEIRMMLSVGAGFIPKPKRYTAFGDLEIKIDGKPLRAVSLPGHTMGIVGYAIGHDIFCGDAALEGKANVVNLSDELSSLGRLKSYQQIYPGHKRFPLRRSDIAQVEVHLVERSQEVLRMVKGGKTLREVVNCLYGEITEKNFAKRLVPLRQAISYLRYLEGRGQVERKDSRWRSTH
jgi:glyoxylase-like metal-dependent hydrolase (beta-lactamase superfamily II)